MDFPAALPFAVRLLRLSPEQMRQLRQNVLEEFDREEAAGLVSFLDCVLEAPERWARLREDLEQFEAEMRYELAFEEGRLLGCARVLRRLLTHRFGAPPEWVEERLAGASLEEFFGWAERMLEAEALEEVFA